jgi:hypothetical protein
MNNLLTGHDVDLLRAKRPLLSDEITTLQCLMSTSRPQMNSTVPACLPCVPKQERHRLGGRDSGFSRKVQSPPGRFKLIMINHAVMIVILARRLSDQFARVILRCGVNRTVSAAQPYRGQVCPSAGDFYWRSRIPRRPDRERVSDTFALPETFPID